MLNLLEEARVEGPSMFSVCKTRTVMFSFHYFEPFILLRLPLQSFYSISELTNLFYFHLLLFFFYESTFLLFCTGTYTQVKELHTSSTSALS